MRLTQRETWLALALAAILASATAPVPPWMHMENPFIAAAAATLP